jgi:hypothetical protein
MMIRQIKNGFNALSVRARAEFAHFVHNLASKIFFFVAANMYSIVLFEKLYISFFLCL